MSLQPFPRPAGEIGLGAFATEGPTITLQDLVQLDVRVTWDEAVSIIEELCVAAQGSVMRPIPAARDILLNPVGSVSIRQAAGGVPDPIEAARRLHELLGTTVVPAPLRLFVSQAVSSGSYNSLAEFDDALAYFAKPGRQERVKAVYQRAWDHMLSNPQPDPEPVREISTPPAGEPHRYSLRTLAFVGLAAAVTASMIVGLGLYLWPKGTGTPAAIPARTAAGTDAPAADAATPAPELSTASGAAAQPAESVAAGPSRPPQPISGSAAARFPSPPTTGRLRSGTSLPPSRPSPTPSTSPASPVAAPSSVPTPPASSAGRAEGVRPQPALAPSAGDASDAGAAADSPQPLYSEGDSGVKPAVLVKQQLLPPAFVPAVGGRPVRLELIVSPTGAVERARFIEAPHRMADMMLLSSAKTWIFTPALKDGQPVRYRVVMSWVAAP